MAAAFTNQTSRVTLHLRRPRVVVKRIYETRPPSEILLKTEKVTLALEGIGDGKIRCSVSSWEDVKIHHESQVVEIRAGGSGSGCRASRARQTLSSTGCWREP